MNPLPRLLVLGLLTAVAVPTLAGAHSLADIQQDLHDKEKYFEIKNEPAPAFALQDAEGRPLRLDDLQGKAVVLHFIYAGCPDVCPLHAEKIAQVQAMVNATPMKDQVQFITVTTDPLRDLPEVMSAYGEPHGLDPANWVFLTSGPDKPEDTTRKLAERYGHGFTVTDDGYQVHSVVTHVIAPNGVWAANFHGLGFEPTNLLVFLNALVNDQHGPDGHGAAAAEDSTLWGRLKALF